MGYCCADCGDSEYTCTAWDGKGEPYVGNVTNPNHNLVEECPRDIAKCEYRRKKIKSKPLVTIH